jgi:hypothetical protein
MRNLLITVSVALALAPLLALSAYADELSFGIEQASVIIADAGEEDPTYGPGQNIVLNDRGKYLEVNVVYTTGKTNGEVGIGYKWSDDSGVTWFSKRILASGDYNLLGAHMAVSKTGPENYQWHYLWAGSSRKTSETYGKIYHMTYKGQPKAINNPAVVAYYKGRSIAADDKGGVHVAYAGVKDGKENGIYYAGSTDSGANFNLRDTIAVCDRSCGFDEPVITVDDKGQVIVLYQDTKDPKAGMKLARRVEGKWVSTDIPNGGFGTIQFQSLASNGGKTCAAWGTFKPHAVVASCSTDSGKTWNTSKIVDNLPVFRPSIAVDSSGTPSLAWIENIGGGSSIYISRLSEGKWSHPRAVVSESFYMTEAKIAVDQRGKAYIVFSQDGEQGYHLKLTREK